MTGAGAPDEGRVDGGRSDRDDGGYQASQTPRAEPAPDDIFPPATRPVPVVLLALPRARSSLRPEAPPPAPRGGPGPGPADRHQLDQGGQAQRPVSALLPRGSRRRQAG